MTASDLPEKSRRAERRTFREITIDETPFDFTNGFADLHTRVYEEIIAGRGDRHPLGGSGLDF